MNYCISCGKLLNDDGYYCSKCGTIVKIIPSEERCDRTRLAVSPSLAARLAAFANAPVGQYVTFGNYPQKYTNLPTPIEWLVLENDGESLLVISKYGLDCKPYNRHFQEVTWRDCTLRCWLNCDFLQQAFSPEEQFFILCSDITSDEIAGLQLFWKHNNYDFIYCLSVEEAEQFLTHDSLKKFNRTGDCCCYEDNAHLLCVASPYALQRGAGEKSPNSCWYWLRDSRASSKVACGSEGCLNIAGKYVCDEGVVRPALRISLKSRCLRCGVKLEDKAAFCHKCGEPCCSSVNVVPQALSQLNTISTPLVCDLKSFSQVQAGHYIKYGRYPQKNGDSPQPLEWLVLENSGDALLVISKYSLDCQAYHGNYWQTVTWETCNLRQWLNSVFLRKAFTPEEQSFIKLSQLDNDDNPEYATNGGYSTADKLFCLSIKEAEHYLAHDSQKEVIEEKFSFTYIDNQDLLCSPTDYAVERGAYKDGNGCGFFWLRSPAAFDNAAAYVNALGNIAMEGDISADHQSSVRPALRISLKVCSVCGNPLEEEAVTCRRCGRPTHNEPAKEKYIPLSALMKSTAVAFSQAQAGQYIKFGRYPQSDDDAFEPIEWLVLANEGSALLVIAKHGLDSEEYCYNNIPLSPDTQISWENCSLRQWLNSTFIDAAFNKEEQALIKLSYLNNHDNPEYGTAGGHYTQDKIFALSLIEAEYYLANNSALADEDTIYRSYVDNKNLLCTPSSYAEDVCGVDKDEYNGGCYYWLRSPGHHDSKVIGVSCDGDIFLGGFDMDSCGFAVRPALRINFLLCSHCGAQLDSQAAFCRECGQACKASSTVPAMNKWPKPYAYTNIAEIFKARVGDYIRFGHYPKNDGASAEPIEWLVLSKEGEALLVISRYGLASKWYNDTLTNVTWESCSLRQWLNSEFLHQAFTGEERDCIKLSNLEQENNPEYCTAAGNATKDKLFCLSIREAEFYLAHDYQARSKPKKLRYQYQDKEHLLCLPSVVAVQQGVDFDERTKSSAYWLRTPGLYNETAALVTRDCHISVIGCQVNMAALQGQSHTPAVRPAMRIIRPQPLDIV